MPVLVGRVGFTLQAPWLKDRSFDLIDYNDNVLQEGLIKTEALVIPADLPVAVRSSTDKSIRSKAAERRCGIYP